MNNKTKICFPLVFIITISLVLAASFKMIFAQSEHEKLAREIFKELIEINSSPDFGSTKAVEAMAKRLRDAGFPDSDIFVGGPNDQKKNIIARYRGTGTKRPLLLLAHLDVVNALRSDWTFDPFIFLEQDGYFYGRGTTDDKAQAAIWVANFIRIKKEEFLPNRDIIIALTAAEVIDSFAEHIAEIIKMLDG